MYMNFFFKKNNAWDYIQWGLGYAVFLFVYYAFDPKNESPSKLGKLNQGLHKMIDDFGLDLPAWLQILLLWCFVTLVIPKVLFWFKKK